MSTYVYTKRYYTGNNSGKFCIFRYRRDDYKYLMTLPRTSNYYSSISFDIFEGGDWETYETNYVAPNEIRMTKKEYEKCMVEIELAK